MVFYHEEDNMNLLHLFQAGGFMMYPLVLCSFFVVMILFERVKYYSSMEEDVTDIVERMPEMIVNKDLEGLKALLKSKNGAVSKVLLQGVEHLDHTAISQETVLQGAAIGIVGGLKNYLNYLDVIVTLSPLMGLLGTVIGMIGSFDVLSVSNGQPFAVTAGVAEALICTATGLFVAIIALIAYTYLSQRVNRFVSKIESVSSLYLSMVGGIQR